MTDKHKPAAPPALTGGMPCIKSEAYGVSAEQCGCPKCRPAPTEGKMCPYCDKPKGRSLTNDCGCWCHKAPSPSPYVCAPPLPDRAPTAGVKGQPEPIQQRLRRQAGWDTSPKVPVVCETCGRTGHNSRYQYSQECRDSETAPSPLPDRAQGSAKELAISLYELAQQFYGKRREWVERAIKMIEKDRAPQPRAQGKYGLSIKEAIKQIEVAELNGSRWITVEAAELKRLLTEGGLTDERQS